MGQGRQPALFSCRTGWDVGRLNRPPNYTPDMPMRPFIETERMLLHRFTESDIDNLVELDSDPEVMRYITGGKPTPRAQIVDDVLPAFLADYQRFDGFGFWAAIDKAGGEFLGWFHLRPGPDHSGDEQGDVEYAVMRTDWERACPAFLESGSDAP